MNNFKNGFKCYIDNLKCNKSYCISLFIKAGSYLEKPNEKGISHFLEHMLFKGTRKYKNLANLLDINGFQYNALTMKECTLFYIKSTNILLLPLIVDILYEIAFHSTLDKSLFENEKTVVKDEILEDQSDMNTLLFDMSEKLMFNQKYYDKPIHSYDYKITGSKHDIDVLTLDNVMSFYERYYKINNMFMVCTGNLNDSNILLALKNTFLKEKVQFLPPYIRKKTLINNRDYILYDKLYSDEGNSGVVIINYPICGFNNKDRYILNLFSFILTKGISSELFELLRNKNGIVYSIESSTDIYYRYFGLFNISFTTNQQNIFKALSLILNFLKNDISEKQLNKAKILYIEEINFSNEDIVNKGEMIGLNILYDSPVLSTVEIEQEINKVSINDIYRIKKKYIVNNKMVLVHMSNIDNLDFEDFMLDNDNFMLDNE